MKIITNLLATLSLFFALAYSHDPLLALSSRNSCLKGIVATFVREDDCSHLSDASKANV